MGLIVAPSDIEITIYQGATFRHSFTWKSGPTEVSALPVDLTGCVARAQVRETHGSAVAIATLTTENGGVILGGATGTITLYLSAATTTAFPTPAKPVRWDLEIVWPDGDVVRLLEGQARISPEVTR